MSTTQERNLLRAAVTRDFETSRHARASLAAAFERALPTIRRAVDPGPASTAVVQPPHRARKAVS